MNIEKSAVEKMNHRIKNSVMLKLLTITILMLLLLIPSSMIKSIIGEREALRQEAIQEVSMKWANEQKINGPILSIPLTYEYTQDDKRVLTTKYLHILPEELNIDGNIDTEELKRGIYEVVVYNSDLSITGIFNLNKPFDTQNLVSINYDKAFLTMGISDLRGIKDQININWDHKKLKIIPGSKLSSLIQSGITADLPNLKDKLKEQIDFSIDLSFQGSKNISFVPLGSTTNVSITSTWPSPSFMGNFIPKKREISNDGFSAKWKVLELNRNYPSSWIGNSFSKIIKKSVFGIDLMLPVNDYQKSMRSAKYAIMSIALTFLIFFLVEILNKRRIHPFQYALVGLGLILFYILLVSISEHSNFNFAYLISSLAIVSMISLYSISVFKNRKLSIILLLTLSSIYGFLFVTLQLADYALLMGAVGLTLILGTTMYFTRNINWYKLNSDNDE